MFRLQRIEVDRKHSSSFVYEKSLPLILTSNYSIDHIADGAPGSLGEVDALALKNRSRQIFMYANMVDTEEEFREAQERGEQVVLKPDFRITNEVLCYILNDLFDDEPEPNILSNEQIQVVPPHILEKFLDNEKKLSPILPPKKLRLC